MKQLKCDTCGATLELSGDGLHAVCPMCGNVYEYRSPKEEMAVQQMNEATDLRLNMNFDDAIKKYRLVIKNNPEDAEGYWGLLLSQYGIAYEYEEDTKKYVPTFHRNRRGNILENDNAKKALEYASDGQRATYEKALGELRHIQEGIERFADSQQPYDVFISFKATDGDAKTIDRDIAYNIYDELESRGIRTFFSEVSLRSMVAEDFEAVIFSAINSCRVFILVGTSKANINSLWVKNEWTRYSERVADDRANGMATGSRFAVLGGLLKPSELPREFARTQNVMLSNYAGDSYKKDVAYSVEKLLGIDKKDDKSAIDEKGVKELVDKMVKEKVASSKKTETGTSVDSLLTRMDMFLADGDFDNAHKYAERVLDIDPTCERAYLGNLLADYNVKTKNGLKSVPSSFDTNANYKKIVKYGSKELKDELKGYLTLLKNKLDKQAMDAKYKTFLTKYRADIKAKDIGALRKDLDTFDTFGTWSDAMEKKEACRAFLHDYLEEANIIYETAENTDKDDFEADVLLKECMKQRELVEEATSVVAKLGDFENAKEILPLLKEEILRLWYLQGYAYFELKDYKSAYYNYNSVKEYGDARAQAKKAKAIWDEQVYSEAMALFKKKNYFEARKKFSSLNKYKDAPEKLDICRIKIRADEIARAKAMIRDGKYYEAKMLLTGNPDEEAKKLMAKCNDVLEGRTNTANTYSEPEPEYSDKPKKKPSPKRVVVIALVLLLMILILSFVLPKLMGGDSSDASNVNDNIVNMSEQIAEDIID